MDFEVIFLLLQSEQHTENQKVKTLFFYILSSKLKLNVCKKHHKRRH